MSGFIRAALLILAVLLMPQFGHAITGGAGVDIVDGSATFDSTEVDGNRSWSDGSSDSSITWSWDLSSGTDPSISFGDNAISFGDEQFKIVDDGDPTKRLEFEVGGITGSTTRTITVPDEDFTMLGGSVSASEIEDGDHGDFTYSSGSATLDVDVVAPAEMADADHGDVSWSGGVASVDLALYGQDAVEVFGFACDGSTDDRAAFDSAMDTLTSTGGILFIPNTGSLCKIDDNTNAGADIESNVTIVCETGAGFISDATAVFTNGMLDGAAEHNWGIRNCEFDLNTTNNSAIYSSASAGVQIDSVYVHGMGTTGGGKALVRNDSTSSGYERAAFVSNSLITCDNTASDDNFIGIYIDGASASNGFYSPVARNNVIQDCDLYGIHAFYYAQVIGNNINLDDPAAIGVYANNHVSVSGNKIYGNSTATSAVGIYVLNSDVTSYGNKIDLAATTGAKIGIDVSSSGNGFISDGDNLTIGAGANAVGMRLDNQSIINNCVIASALTPGTLQTGIQPLNGANSSQISDCHITGGVFGVAGPAEYVSTNQDNISVNVRLTDNVITFQTEANVIAATGWQIIGNTLNWVSNGSAAIWLGYDGSTFGSTNKNSNCSGHSTITGNNFFGNTLTTYIKFPMYSGGDCGDITIGGNLFIGGLDNTVSGYAIDFGGGCTSCSDVNMVSVTGNTISMDDAAYAFYFGSNATYESVVISGNSFGEPESKCTASDTPYQCCTGSNAGNCIGGAYSHYAFNMIPQGVNWVDKPRRLCGIWSDVAATTDNQMMSSEGSAFGGSFLLAARAICQGTCTSEATFQLQKLECEASSPDAGNYCDSDSDCTDDAACSGSVCTCGVNLGSSFNGIDPVSEETTDWSAIEAYVDAEDLWGFDVTTGGTVDTDTYLMCVWYLP